MNFRTIIAILIGIIGFGAIGFGVYFGWGFFFPANQSPTTNQATINTQVKNFDLVFDGSVFDYFVNEATNEVIVIQNDGQIFKIKNGATENLSSSSIIGLFSASLSTDKTNLLIGFGRPNAPQFSIFDLGTKEWKRIEKNITESTWAPDSKKIAYLETTPDGSTNLGVLSFATSTATKQEVMTFKSITKLSQTDSLIDWVKSDEIFISSRPSALISGSILSFNLTKNTLAPVITDLNGLTASWNKENQMGLKFFNATKSSGQIGLVNLSGQKLADFTFATLPNKCTFKANSLYCAIPQFINPSVVLPDDYQKDAAFFKDDFYKFNTITGQNEKIFNGDQELIDANNLKALGDKLLLINHYDKKLYSFNLAK